MEITYKLTIRGNSGAEIGTKEFQVRTLLVTLNRSGDQSTLVRENWCDNCKTPTDRHSIEHGKCNVCGAELHR